MALELAGPITNHSGGLLFVAVPAVFVVGLLLIPSRVRSIAALVVTLACVNFTIVNRESCHAML